MTTLPNQAGNLAILFLLLLLCCQPASAYTAFPWSGDMDVFFYNDSADIAGYNLMDQIPQLQNQYTYTSPPVSSTTGEQTIGTWITPAGSPGVTLAPGLWRFRFYASASSDAGKTSLLFRPFVLKADGTKEFMFFGSTFSRDISAGTIPNEYLLSYARRNYTYFAPGERLGVQINVSTDSAAARTVSMDVAGNTNASMVQIGYFLGPSTMTNTAPMMASSFQPNALPMNPVIPVAGLLIAVAGIGLARRRK